MSKLEDGTTFYLEVETIRKHKEFVYSWILTDSLTPSLRGHFSWKTYFQFDCNKRRRKVLSFKWYYEPMGVGTGDVEQPTENNDWVSPSPNSMSEQTMNILCEYAKTMD